MNAGQDSKAGGLIEYCGISWVSNCSNSSSNPWKCPTYRFWNFICCINHRHVCTTSINYGKIFNSLHRPCTLLVKISHFSRKTWYNYYCHYFFVVASNIICMILPHTVMMPLVVCGSISHGTEPYHSSFSK